MNRISLHSLLLCALLVGLCAVSLGTTSEANASPLYDSNANIVYLPMLVRPPAPLPDPTNLTVTAVSTTGIDIRWTDNANNESGFQIERAPISTTAFVLVNTTGANVTLYQDRGLTPGTGYTYRVRAVGPNGNSIYTPVKSAVTQSPTPPAGPTNLNATDTISNSTTLHWTDNANNETGFELEMSTGSGAFTKVYGADVLTPNTSQKTVSPLTPNTTYKFRVRAVNQNGNSAFSNEIQVTTMKALPAAPSNLNYSNLTATSVRLTWTDNANNEAGFELQERVNGGTWNTIRISTHLPANASFIVLSDLSPNTNYEYRVCAVNGGGYSGYSNIVGFRTPAPQPPKLRVVNNVTDDFIISVKINGVEQLPTWEYAFGPGGYRDITVTPGSYTVVVTTGWWNTQSNPPTRFEKYIWTYSAVTLTVGEVEVIQVNDPTIQQLLTEFGDKRAWKGYYLGTQASGDAYFCFYKNGRYRLYDTYPDGYFKQIETGDYSLVSYGSVATRFLTESDNGQESYEGLLDMLRGYFTMDNGPSGWVKITYTKQSLTFTNQYCPATAP